MLNARPDLEKIIWLASYPKSGNTWLRLFLESYLAGKKTGVQLSKLEGFTRYTDTAYTLFDAVADGEDTSTFGDAQIDPLRLKVQQRLAQQAASGIFVKTHNAFAQHEGAMLIHPAFTQAAVYLLRNPLDIVDSMADHMGFSIDDAIDCMNNPRFSIGGKRIFDLSEYKDQSEREQAKQQGAQATSHLFTWSMHVNSWAAEPNPKLLVLRYEDLLAKPFPCFKSLLEFLNLDVNKDLLRASIKNTALSALQKQEKAGGFLELSQSSQSGKFFRRGKAGSWTRILTKDQAARIIKDHGEVMEKFGYTIPDLDKVYS